MAHPLQLPSQPHYLNLSSHHRQRAAGVQHLVIQGIWAGVLKCSLFGMCVCSNELLGEDGKGGGLNRFP
jgi:hypothetical protein